MQTYKGQELMDTVDSETIARLLGRAEELEAAGATHHVIGKIPERGTVVEINGLRYMVRSYSQKQGTIVLEILKPNKER